MAHREARPAPDLLVNAPHVFPDDAQSRHRDSEQREEDREESEDALDLGAHDQAPHEEKHTEGDAA